MPGTSGTISRGSSPPAAERPLTPLDDQTAVQTDPGRLRLALPVGFFVASALAAAQGGFVAGAIALGAGGLERATFTVTALEIRSQKPVYIENSFRVGETRAAPLFTASETASSPELEGEDFVWPALLCVPAGQPPSGDAHEATVEWWLDVHLHVRRAPDYARRFALLITAP